MVKEYVATLAGDGNVTFTGITGYLEGILYAPDIQAGTVDTVQVIVAGTLVVFLPVDVEVQEYAPVRVSAKKDGAAIAGVYERQLLVNATVNVSATVTSFTGTVTCRLYIVEA